MATLSDLGVINFMIPHLSQFLKRELQHFFEDVEFGGRNKVRDIVFEEESTSIPTIAFDNVQVPIPVIY